MYKSIQKTLVTLRQMQHAPNRLWRLMQSSDAWNFKYHWYEVAATCRDTDYCELSVTLIEQIDSISKHYSRSWSDSNVKRWLNTLAVAEISDDARVLEVGSFEGRSTNFWLLALQRSTVVCVDTWEGGDEHKDLGSTAHADMPKVLERFRLNTQWAGDRVKECRQTSSDYFSTTTGSKGLFDLIYIDGSHHGADVICDAVNSFKCLSPGGVIIFDDFLWRYYANADQNPWSAINFFIRLYRDKIVVLRFGEQVHIKKKR